MNNKVAFFLPTRKGSHRVQNKNTRSFAGINGGLVELKLQQLIKTKKIDEIIFSSNDEECIHIAETYSKLYNRIKIIRRPDTLCLDSTDLQDLIAYVPTVTNANHILWGHVTTPMLNERDYDKALEVYFEKIFQGYDSLVSVVGLKNFLLNKKGQLINNTTRLSWPRTQDLETLYEINHGIFLTSRSIYEQQRNRLGKNPYLYMMNKIKSIDIDWEEDFKMAETLYKNNIQ